MTTYCRIKNEKEGTLIVISAPSGTGKTTICKEILRKIGNLEYSISYTTRLPRKDEKDGREYFFVDEKTFKKMIDNKKFVEWANVHQNYYGTSKDFLNKALKNGKNVILEIDVQGGEKIKEIYPYSCMVFIAPPSFKTLKERLIARNKDSAKTIKLRLKNAKDELKYLPKYDYLVINENLNDAVSNVKNIILSQSCKIRKK
ncbi:MAG: guanylate kinase [Elusimicrobiota bacterium]|jgi:guanylate kinase|nr:guanylate kinase [Elusimicrobiota bacterium]